MNAECFFHISRKNRTYTKYYEKTLTTGKLKINAVSVFILSTPGGARFHCFHMPINTNLHPLHFLYRL